MVTPSLRSSRWLRTIVSGIAGGVAWALATTAFFGPAQTILADPDLQSAKMLAVFSEIEPLPRLATNPLPVLLLAVVILGLTQGIAFSILEPALPRRRLARGLRFGALSWLLMVPWFEFYLPWNVLHEPAPLVLLECILWLAVLLTVGLALSFAYPVGSRSNKAERAD